MSTGHVVVEGAICKCKFGFTPDSLVVQTQNKAFINDSAASKKLIGNTLDLGVPFQAKNFGQCKLKPTSGGYRPCVPAITQWTNFYDKVYLPNNGQILTEKSKATCATAGSPCVEFTWHGQTAGVASNAIEDADEEVQSQLNPLVNTKKMVESYDNNLDEGDAEPQKEKEKVISADSELYLRSSAGLKAPYLDSTETINFESSKPFIAGIKSIFGDDIKHPAIKEFMNDLEAGKIPLPEWKIERNLSDSEAGFHKEGKIHLNEKLILKAEKDPATNWLLFRVIIEEIGHYVDYLLRNQYDTIGGDAPGDEGTLFAADFIRYNELLSKDFEFATFHIKSEDGGVRKFVAKVNVNQPNSEQKAKELIFIEDNDDDHGLVTLNSGKKVRVEFFKIRGGGAIHEKITIRAAIAVGFRYDKRLREGCAWPDVPCKDVNSIETCYYKTWRKMHTKGTIAYASHYGDLQYWHSMAPTGNNTNKEVVDKIVEQAKKWFKRGIDTKIENEKDDGLFHIGKILHMVQDSYSLSHVQRNESNQIIQIQSYNDQDSHKHAIPDKDDKAKGVKDATKASIWILQHYKNSKSTKNEKEYLPKLEEILRQKIYPFQEGSGGKLAGGSLKTYEKKPEK